MVGAFDQLYVGDQLVTTPVAAAASTVETPDVASLYHDGINAYEMARYDLAEARFREALTLFPESATLHNKLAMTLMQQDRSLEAVLAYQRAIMLNPALVEAHENLAAVYASLEMDALTQHEFALVQ